MGIGIKSTPFGFELLAVLGMPAVNEDVRGRRNFCPIANAVTFKVSVNVPRFHGLIIETKPFPTFHRRVLQEAVIVPGACDSRVHDDACEIEYVAFVVLVTIRVVPTDVLAHVESSREAHGIKQFRGSIIKAETHQLYYQCILQFTWNSGTLRIAPTCFALILCYFVLLYELI